MGRIEMFARLRADHREVGKRQRHSVDMGLIHVKSFLWLGVETGSQEYAGGVQKTLGGGWVSHSARKNITKS